MKLSEILGWPDKQKEYFGVNTVQAGEAFGHNTALTSCDREIDREALAKELFERNQKKLYGDKGLSWEECLSINPESRFSSANDCREIASFIISTMPTWLKPTERK